MEGETGRGQKGGGERGKRRVDFTDGYDEMPGWTWAIGLINGCKQMKYLG